MPRRAVECFVDQIEQQRDGRVQPRHHCAPFRTIATPAAMTRAATPVAAVIDSPPTLHPSATATSGFTYACVPTRDGDATRSSHSYAENATTEPNTIR